MLNIIIPIKNSEVIAKYIRDKSIGLTTVQGKGLKTEVQVLMIFTHRKNILELKQGILAIEPHALIAENDVVTLSGGTLPHKHKIVK